MTRILFKAAATTAVAFAFASILHPAYAAGPYDGTWVIDLPANGETTQHEFACPAARIQIRITDNQVSGELMRAGRGNTVETGGSGSSAAPVTGSVTQDGMLSTDWSGYHAKGKLSGNSGKLDVQRTCGPETAMATRAAP